MAALSPRCCYPRHREKQPDRPFAKRTPKASRRPSAPARPKSPRRVKRRSSGKCYNDPNHAHPDHAHSGNHDSMVNSLRGKVASIPPARFARKRLGRQRESACKNTNVPARTRESRSRIQRHHRAGRNKTSSIRHTPRASSPQRCQKATMRCKGKHGNGEKRTRSGQPIEMLGL